MSGGEGKRRRRSRCRMSRKRTVRRSRRTRIRRRRGRRARRPGSIRRKGKRRRIRNKNEEIGGGGLVGGGRGGKDERGTQSSWLAWSLDVALKLSDKEFYWVVDKGFSKSVLFVDSIPLGLHIRCDYTKSKTLTSCTDATFDKHQLSMTMPSVWFF